MNVDLLAPGSTVFYLSGTTWERVPATIVGLSSFPECVAISYERSGHTRYYRDCPVARLTFPIVRADSPDSDRGLSPPPKYAGEVFKLLLLVDHLGQYRWVGGLACGVRSDTRILKEYDPEIRPYKKRGGCDVGRGISRTCPWRDSLPQTKEGNPAQMVRTVQRRSPFFFISGRGEHPFTQLYTWGGVGNFF